MKEMTSARFAEFVRTRLPYRIRVFSCSQPTVAAYKRDYWVWCRDMLGQPGVQLNEGRGEYYIDWGCKWDYWDRDFFFAEELDAITFKLRWC